MSAAVPSAERGVRIPHLVFALLYLGGATAWLLVATGRLDGPDLAYLVPGVLVVAGAFGLLAMALEARPRDRGRGKVRGPEQFTDPGDELDHTSAFPLDKETR